MMGAKSSRQKGSPPSRLIKSIVRSAARERMISRQCSALSSEVDFFATVQYLQERRHLVVRAMSIDIRGLFFRWANLLKDSFIAIENN